MSKILTDPSKFWLLENSNSGFETVLTGYLDAYFPVSTVWILFWCKKKLNWKRHTHNLGQHWKIKFFDTGLKFQQGELSSKCVSNWFTSFLTVETFRHHRIFFPTKSTSETSELCRKRTKISIFMIDPSKSWFCEKPQCVLKMFYLDIYGPFPL